MYHDKHKKKETKRAAISFLLAPLLFASLSLLCADHKPYDRS